MVRGRVISALSALALTVPCGVDGLTSICSFDPMPAAKLIVLMRTTRPGSSRPSLLRWALFDWLHVAENVGRDPEIEEEVPWRSDGLADQSLAESQRLIRCWLGLLLRAVSTELRLRNSGTALTQTGHGQNSCLHCSQALVRLLLWGARAGHAQGHCARSLGSSSTSHSCLRCEEPLGSYSVRSV